MLKRSNILWSFSESREKNLNNIKNNIEIKTGLKQKIVIYFMLNLLYKQFCSVKYISFLEIEKTKFPHGKLR